MRFPTRLFSLLLVLVLSSCISNGRKTARNGLFSTGTGSDGSSGSTPAPEPPAFNFTPLTDPLSLTSPPKDSNQNILLEATVYARNASSIFTDYCTLSPISGSPAKTCSCQYTWPNQDSAIPPTITSTQFPLVYIQGSTLRCALPSQYSDATEIPNNTRVSVSLIQNSPDSSGKLLALGTVLKGATNQSGGNLHQDDQGTLITDISRYTCYEKNLRSHKIFSGRSQGTNGAPTLHYATDFCMKKLAGAGSGSSDSTSSQHCTGSLAFEESAGVQSFYYSLYVKAIADIYSDNQIYHCPKIDGPNGGSQFWPLDSTFSLAQTYSTRYSVPVQGPSVVGSNQTDNDVVNTRPENCIIPGASTNTDDNFDASNLDKSVSYKCLGFAKPAKPNGSCESITMKNADGSTSVVPAFRLRRYLAVYPVTFDADGSVFQQPMGVDMVYVLDRLAIAPLGTPAPQRQDMLGPKPCPFAYYDRYGVAGTPLYHSTTSEAWRDKNIEGLHFPNDDNPAINSCSALMPMIKKGPTSDLDQILFGTSSLDLVNPATVETGNGLVNMTTVYIRPSQPWGPYYVEDTSFRACAPSSFLPMDPPIYQAKQNYGNDAMVGYCAAVYPTDLPGSASNPQLDPSDPAYHINTATTIPRPMLAAGNFTGQYAARQITFANYESLSFRDPPLLAPRDDIFTLMASDPTYSCSLVDPATGDPIRHSLPNGCCTNSIHMSINPASYDSTSNFWAGSLDYFEYGIRGASGTCKDATP